MNKLLQLLAALYGALLRFYPREFKLEFGYELRSVFMALAQDAASAGAPALAAFCLRELRDFPVNLLRTHLEKNPMSRIFDPESVRFALRSVLAFIVLLTTYSLSLFAIMVQMSNNAIAFDIPGYFNDRSFHQVLVLVFAWLIASMIGGTIFAVIFGEHPRLRWPLVLAIVASLPWSVPYAVFQFNPSQLQVSMASFGENSVIMAIFLLLAAVVGILAIMLSREQARFRWFVLAGLLVWLPGMLSSQIYNLTFIKTDVPVQLLMALEDLALGAFLAGMLGLLLKDRRKMFWLIVAGVILYPLVSYAFQQINGWLLAPFFPMEGFTHEQAVLGEAIASTILGLLFGLPIALIFVWLRKGKFPALPWRKQPEPA
jgi:hypothetical protein